MIILTKELAELRIQARTNFPNADFLPGDDPPVGETLYRTNYSGKIEPLVVLGEFQPEEAQKSLRYWWKVDWHYRGERHTALEWPPNLRRTA